MWIESRWRKLYRNPITIKPTQRWYSSVFFYFTFLCCSVRFEAFRDALAADLSAILLCLYKTRFSILFHVFSIYNPNFFFEIWVNEYFGSEPNSMILRYISDPKQITRTELNPIRFEPTRMKKKISFLLKRFMF